MKHGNQSKEGPSGQGRWPGSERGIQACGQRREVDVRAVQLAGQGLAWWQGRERASVDELNALAQKVRDARDRYDAIKASNGGKRDREDFYLVVCFRDTDDLTDFLAAAGLPDNPHS